MSSFAYAPLHQPGGRTIRLIQLAPPPPPPPSSRPPQNPAGAIGTNHANFYDDEPRCCLFDISLDKAVPYIVVSCAWDDHNDDVNNNSTKTIFVNDKELLASQQLCDLLRYLQRHCRPRDNLFWIGALCINQYDVVEKGLQVSLMRHIYEAAWVVIVWLGHEDDDNDDNDSSNSSNTALKDVHDLHAFFRAYAKSQDRYGMAMKRKELLFPASPFAHRRAQEVLVYEVDSAGYRISNNNNGNSNGKLGSTCGSALGIREDNRGKVDESASIVDARLRYHIHGNRGRGGGGQQAWTWSRISKLLSKPWFRRVWSLHEIYFGSNVQVALGPHMLAWSVLGDVCDAMVRYGLDRSVHHSDGHGVTVRPAGLPNTVAARRLLRSTKNTQHPKSHADLGYLLLGTYAYEASDAWDKVYALSGLASPRDQESLRVVDYSLSPERLFTEVTARMILTGEPKVVSGILSMAGIGWYRETSSSLPSWVPDWNNPPQQLRKLYSRTLLREADITGSIVGGSVIKSSGTAANANNMDPPQNFTVVGPDGRRTLRVRGCLVDKIEYLIKSPCPEIAAETGCPGDMSNVVSSGQHHHSCWSDWMMDAVEMINQGARSPYPTREPINEALWRTLITSKAPSGEHAGPEYGGSFQRVVGRPFDGVFSTGNTKHDPSGCSDECGQRQQQDGTDRDEDDEMRRLVSTLDRHVQSPDISPGLAYLERMSYRSPQRAGDSGLGQMWLRSYELYGRGRCLFTTQKGFLGLAAPGLARGGEFYVAYIRGVSAGRPVVLERADEEGPEEEAVREVDGGGCAIGAAVPKFRLISDCYLHGGHILERRARDVRNFDIY